MSALVVQTAIKPFQSNFKLNLKLIYRTGEFIELSEWICPSSSDLYSDWLIRQIEQLKNGSWLDGIWILMDENSINNEYWIGIAVAAWLKPNLDWALLDESVLLLIILEVITSWVTFVHHHWMINSSEFFRIMSFMSRFSAGCGSFSYHRSSDRAVKSVGIVWIGAVVSERVDLGHLDWTVGRWRRHLMTVQIVPYYRNVVSILSCWLCLVSNWCESVVTLEMIAQACYGFGRSPPGFQRQSRPIGAACIIIV